MKLYLLINLLVWDGQYIAWICTYTYIMYLFDLFAFQVHLIADLWLNKENDSIAEIYSIALIVRRLTPCVFVSDIILDTY